MKTQDFKFSRYEWLAITVVSFGYFVDLYDLMLYSIVRKTSLLSIGVSKESLTNIGIDLMNWQLVGLVLGGLLWGIWADKKGRVSVLFLSILTYSIANIANAYITSVEGYSICRILAGIGLAGELGVGLTLLSETVAPSKRTIAGMLVTAFGMLGGALAALVASRIPWQTAYLTGGGIGLVMLIVRYKIKESVLFQKSKENKTKGNLLYIIKNKKLLLKYLACIFSGSTAFIFTGIFIALAPEFGKAVGVKAEISAGTAIFYYLISVAGADIFAGFLSKYLQSRKKVLILFILVQTLAVFLYLFYPSSTVEGFYFRCALLGVGVGYWGVLITNTAEQFGTNIRATVTTSMSNIIRGIAFPAGILFKNLIPKMGIIYSAAFVILFLLIISLLAVLSLKDKFETNLNYTE